MNEKQIQENQQEFFSGFSNEPKQADRIPSIAKAQKPILISTTIEQLLLIGILAILLFCLIFFLGMLRGRSVGLAQSQPPVSVVTKPLADPQPIAAPAVSLSPIPVAAKVVSKRENKFVVINEGPAKPYTIQVLTSKKRSDAEVEASLLKKKGFNAQALQSGVYTVVCVGFYANKEEAKKDLAYFTSKYKGSYLRRR